MDMLVFRKVSVAPHSHPSKCSTKVVAFAAIFSPNPCRKTLVSGPEVQLNQNSCLTAPGEENP